MTFFGLLTLSVLGICLMTALDTLVYRVPYMISLYRLFLDYGYYNASCFVIVLLALLLALWNDVSAAPSVKRMIARISGKERRNRDWERS